MQESADLNAPGGLLLNSEITLFSVGELGVYQGKLKAFLHRQIRAYYKYRYLRKQGCKIKAPVRLVDLQKQQTNINKIRVQLGIGRIRLIQDLKKTLKEL